MRHVKYPTPTTIANGVTQTVSTPAATRPGQRADKVYRIVVIKDGQVVRAQRKRKDAGR